MSPIVHECSCGRTYTAASWGDLALVGYQRDDVEVIALRQCECGSTRGLLIWARDDEHLADADATIRTIAPVITPYPQALENAERAMAWLALAFRNVERQHDHKDLANRCLELALELNDDVARRDARELADEAVRYIDNDRIYGPALAAREAIDLLAAVVVVSDAREAAAE